MSENLPAVAPTKERLVVRDSQNSMMDTAKFEHSYRVAVALSKASLIPEHLAFTGTKGNKVQLSPEKVAGNILLVVNQALRWGMDPIALMPESYVVGGKLAYQGKCVAAVINSRGGLKRPLAYKFNSKNGDALAAVCYGSESDIPPEALPLLKKYVENEDREALSQLDDMGVMAVRVSVGQAKTDNHMWKSDPEQKLVYNTAIKWSRRHRPEIVMGVMTEDEADLVVAAHIEHPPQIESAPPRTLDALADRLQQPATGVVPTLPEPTSPASPAKTPEPAAGEAHSPVGRTCPPADAPLPPTAAQVPNQDKPPEQVQGGGLPVAEGGEVGTADAVGQSSENSQQQKPREPASPPATAQPAKTPPPQAQTHWEFQYEAWFDDAGHESELVNIAAHAGRNKEIDSKLRDEIQARCNRLIRQLHEANR